MDWLEVCIKINKTAEKTPLCVLFPVLFFFFFYNTRGKVKNMLMSRLNKSLHNNIKTKIINPKCIYINKRRSLSSWATTFLIVTGVPAGIYLYKVFTSSIIVIIFFFDKLLLHKNDSILIKNINCEHSVILILLGFI